MLLSAPTILWKGGQGVPRLNRFFLFFALAFSILTSLVLGQRIAAQDDSRELAEHLWQVLKSEIKETPITGDAETACKRLIENGAPKIKDRAGAERDIKRFADEMVRQASKDEETGHKKIDLAAYKRAYSSVCPLYPFC
jgi:hypothetical protein